ncbi:MAG: 4Fe-4S binding protein [Desulfuromonadaceae bacterium]
MPPLLPLQSQAVKTRIHLETDGSGFVDIVSSAPTVNVTACSGCGRCVAACPEKIISLETKRFHKNAVMQPPERCTSCGRCIDACPIEALHW